MPTSGFSGNIWFSIPNSRGGNGHLPTLRTGVRSLTILYQVHKQRQLI